MIKKTICLLVVLLLSVNFVACVQTEKTGKPKNIKNKGTLKEDKEKIIVRTDADNLVKVKVENGVAEAYIMEFVPKAREMVEVYGMKFMSFGEYTEINYEDCELISLGTDHPEHFVTEFIYAVSDFGNIYELDVLTNEWIPVREN